MCGANGFPKWGTMAGQSRPLRLATVAPCLFFCVYGLRLASRNVQEIPGSRARTAVSTKPSEGRRFYVSPGDEASIGAKTDKEIALWCYVKLRERLCRETPILGTLCRPKSWPKVGGRVPTLRNDAPAREAKGLGSIRGKMGRCGFHQVARKALDTLGVLMYYYRRGNVTATAQQRGVR